MSKITCVVLCAVAVSISSVYAGEEEKAAFHEAMKPFVIECAMEHGVSDADLHKAKDTRSPDSLKPCFIACVFKKFDIITNKGKFDADANTAQLKKFVKDDDYFTVLSDIGKKCESVNDEAVSDGEAGCERAMLLAKCYMDKKSEMPI